MTRWQVVGARAQISEVLLCLLLLCDPLRGIDRDRRIDQLYHTGWTMKDGAPGEVHALAQTTDGYLWLGTASGLFRFDGVHFEPYRPQSGQPFLQRNVYSLLAVPDGGLWVGFWAGGVSFIKDGTVKSYREQDGLPSRAVLAFVRDRQGVTWIAAGASGLARLEGSHWRKIGVDWNFSGTALSVFEDHNGTLWVGTVDKVFFLLKGTEKFQMAADQLRYVMKLAEASDGFLWMAETSGTVRPVPLQGKTADIQAPKIKVGSQALLFDDQGSLWITSLGDGIRRVPNPELRRASQTGQFSPPAEIFTQKNGLTGDYMFCVLKDREGNIWTGTNAGLDRFRQSALVPVSLPPGSFSTALVEGDESVVWAGILPNHTMTRLQDGKAVFVGTIDRAYRDPNGVIWLATPSQLLRFANERLHLIDPSGEHIRLNQPGSVDFGGGLVVRPIDLPEGRAKAITPETRVRALTKDRSGKLWVSIAGSGVFRLDGLDWTSLESLGGPKGSAISEFTDSNGTVWFGFANNTVAAMTGDKIQTFSRKDGVSVGNIMSFQCQGSNIWIGGDGGLALFDGGHFRPVVPVDGDAFGGVTGIMAGEGLWLSENRGVIHIPEAELKNIQSNPAYHVAFEVFGPLDGLPAQLQKTFVLPSAIRTTDGLLWFATAQGVVWINPKQLSRNKLPPPVSIETITANGQKYNFSKPLELPARTDNFQIVYTGLSLTIPERVRFRYRLDGLDKIWQDVGTRREAIYTNLGPGAYRFRVIACNNDGVWNETGAALDLTIAPTYYQTLWFRVLCGIAAAGGLWFLYLLRVKQVTVQIQLRLGERLAERERIARELHDTLLQGVQGLMLHFGAIMKQLPPHEPTHHMMEKALRIADEVLLEGRDRVRDLRSEVTPLHELSTVLASSGEELAQDNAIAFNLAVVGSVRALDPVVRDEAYRIGREALVNAFRHSQASTIEIEITYDRASLRLRVRDDGSGIDQETLNSGLPGHWGLSGMRERAQKLGGQLSFWSRPGAGTEVDLVIPAKFAYPRSPRPVLSHWLQRALFRRGDK